MYTGNVLVPAILLIALCGGFLFYIDSSASQLPEPVATHFGVGGQADGWMTRNGYGVFLSCVGIGLPLLIVVLGYVCRFFPASSIKIPHREYWLAPERREETDRFVFGQLFWMACLMVMFLAGMHYLTILANRLTPPHLTLEPFLAVVGGFLAATAIWLVVFVRHFSRPS